MENDKRALPDWMAEAAAKEPSVVSLDEAIALFDLLADMKLAFESTEAACSRRAHQMCQVVVNEGLIPQKIWALESKNHRLKPMLATGPVDWWFHVALCLKVRMPDETLMNMALDPAIYDGPVPVEEWGKLLTPQPEKVSITRLGVAPPGYDGDFRPNQKTTCFIDDVLLQALESQERAAGIRTVLRSDIRHKHAPKLEGRTWKTEPLPGPTATSHSKPLKP